MKTTHLKGALAASTALLCPVVAAQAQEGSLEVYGVAHLSIDAATELQGDDVEIASNSSRIGFRGDLPLTSNVIVEVQFEQGLDLTNDGTNDGNGPGDSGNIVSQQRNSYIGLATPLGKVRWGRQSGLNAWVYDVNPFADQVGDLGNVWGASGLAGRVDNAFTYQTPSIAGHTLTTLYSPDSEDGADDSLVVAKLDVARGPLFLGLGWAKAQQQGNLDDHVSGALTVRYAPQGLFGYDGSWVGAGVMIDQSAFGIDDNDRATATLASVWQVNDRMAVKAQAAWSFDDRDARDGGQLALGVDYQATETLMVYGAVAAVENDDLAGFTVDNYGHGRADAPTALGVDPAIVSFGIIWAPSKTVY